MIDATVPPSPREIQIAVSILELASTPALHTRLVEFERLAAEARQKIAEAEKAQAVIVQEREAHARRSAELDAREKRIAELHAKAEALAELKSDILRRIRAATEAA